MAEAVAFDVAKSVLGFLSQQALEKIGELYGVKAELKELQKRVSTIQAVLLDAQRRCHQNPPLKVWVAQVKDALYDAEDLLGEFYTESQLKDLRNQNKIIKEVSTFFSSSNQLKLRFKMVRRLEEVRRRFHELGKEARDFHLLEGREDREGNIAARRHEDEHSYIPSKEIIGRDDDKREIIKQLLQSSDEEENISVVSIVGIGGLGKTALAKCVFNEEDVNKHFELRMWVTISDDFDIKKIVSEIIASAKNGERPAHLGMDQLQSHLRDEIDRKRYLLVLDDSWNENREEWRNLKMLLDGGARGSKILITTRSPIVANISGSMEPYVLKGLSDSASLGLFMACASSKRQEILESEKASIGKEIVEKCYGVPLALRVIGNMLYSKNSKAEWLSFKDNELQKVPLRENDITAVLKISYDHLPSYLKQCFAFCSLFPKDYEMEKSTLTSLWIAQGFIQPSSTVELDLEQEAHDSFMHLLHRNFFQDREDDDLGNVKTCKMHDLMHDLACQVAGTERHVLGSNRKGTLLDNTIRHLSYPSNEVLLDEFPKLQLENMKLRTFLSTDTYTLTLSSIDFASKLICRWKYLRALTLRSTDMEVVPNCLCKLKLLSYLDLSYNERLKRLPESIKSLQNLMTLILFGCDKLEELPRNIVKLVKLTNLYLPNGLKGMPRGLGERTSLRILTHFIVAEASSNAEKYAGLNELSGLNNLRGELTIEMGSYIKNAAVESKSAILKGKQFLDILNLRWNGDIRESEVEVMKNQETLLEGLQPHANLRRLLIVGYSGTVFPRWMMEDLPPLGLLPRLQKLYIIKCSELMALPDRMGDLTSLQSLLIMECPKLMALPNRMGDLTSLSELRIVDCPNLTSLPQSITQLKSLQRFWIMSCPKLMTLPDRMDDLTSLSELRITDYPNPTSLPQSITQLKSLRYLDIMRFPKLMALPDRMGDLTSLSKLHIENCPNLTSLPRSITQLTSLQVCWTK